MSVYGGMPMQPGVITPGMPVGGMMPMYGTPAPYRTNSLGMSGLGSDYGGPIVDPYPPTIARTGSLYTPSMYGDSRSLYGDDLYDRERYYDDEYYGRGRSYYDDPDYRYRRSSSRASRRSRRRDYDDYYYDRDYDRDYYDDRYHRDGRYRSRTYSSGGYYSSSRSGRKREDLSFIQTRNGDVKVLRNGEERIGDKVRRLLGFNPKGVNVVRMKPGERLAAHMSR